MISSLPKDPAILVSFLNTLLRDRYGSLSELCEEEDLSETDLVSRLRDLKYRYDSDTNSIRPE